MTRMATPARVRLEVLTIANPCPADFDAMARVDGDRVRHCRHCDHNVFDLAAMTRTAAERLVADHWSAGRSVCVRLTKRADGTVTTADDCGRSWRAAAARWAGRFGGPVGAALAVLLAALGCDGSPGQTTGTPVPQMPGMLPPPTTMPTTRPTSRPATRPAADTTTTLGGMLPPARVPPAPEVGTGVGSAGRRNRDSTTGGIEVPNVPAARPLSPVTAR